MLTSIKLADETYAFIANGAFVGGEKTRARYTGLEVLNLGQVNSVSNKTHGSRVNPHYTGTIDQLFPSSSKLIVTSQYAMFPTPLHDFPDYITFRTSQEQRGIDGLATIKEMQKRDHFIPTSTEQLYQYFEHIESIQDPRIKNERLNRWASEYKKAAVSFLTKFYETPRDPIKFNDPATLTSP